MWKPGPGIKPFETLKNEQQKTWLKSIPKHKTHKHELEIKTHQLQQESIPDQVFEE